MTSKVDSNFGLEPPLSWKQARFRLRHFLEEYINQSTTPVKKRGPSRSEGHPTLLSRWQKWDLDVYLGAAGTSTAVLIISCLSFAKGGLGTSKNSTDLKFQKSQLVGSILLFLGSLLSIWLIRRRRVSSFQGSDTLKRRVISRFLKKIERQEQECFANDEIWNGDSQESTLNLGGTSLTDIYPVFRRTQRRDGEVTGGSWSRVPTLLLVRGDHVALQVGDIAPASCTAIESPVPGSIIPAGERLTLDILGENPNSVMGNLPRGRTTLPRDSEDLLALCNRMKIYVLLENPLENFLREPIGLSRKPQVLRQLEDIRTTVSILGCMLFAVAIIVLFARIDMTASDLSLHLATPFLVGLGVFPFTAPACLILIEALATSRILTIYHPVASLRRQEISSQTSSNTSILLLQYFLATATSRLSLQDFGRTFHRALCVVCSYFGAKEESMQVGQRLVRIPPASLNLLEKLGAATAFTLVDDELVCEPHALPQQLLMPSAKGLKLLDICPTYEDESDDGDESDSEHKYNSKRSFDGDFHDSDSDDSETGLEHHHHAPSRRKRSRVLRKVSRDSRRNKSFESDSSDDSDSVDHEVQFEDPLWWQHLPSLKCIGLACLLVDQKDEIGNETYSVHVATEKETKMRDGNSGGQLSVDSYKTALVRLLSAERRWMQLRSLAQCIGFSTQTNPFGNKGDTSPFIEKFRLHVISTARLRERLEIDSHERGSEESRWWNLLRPDSTSVIVQDNRSGAYQLVTVGDPRVVTRLCKDAWQGENSTILPLAAHDRAKILETSNSWKLADLDVEAFSYTPIPHTFEQRCDGAPFQKTKFYLLDNNPRGETLLPMQKDKSVSGEWSLLHNQIFLGILGSLVIPRPETQSLLRTLQDAGVRFVYFSPRNMRLTKEIASQMGIDVAWNCAISLRPLDQGEDDPHRMVSTYADWDVNAKLPHGIESVKRHLEEVDNVPLLVSLFTDVSKVTTTQMIETFQEYKDTVIAVGLSHLPRNSRIFSTADLSVGVDVLTECLRRWRPQHLRYNAMFPSEIIFASAISSYSCAFRLRGVESMAYIPRILACGRASLEAASAASIFLICGCLSFAFYSLFCVCSVALETPFVPTMGTVLFLLVVLPLVCLPITMSDADKHSMHRVPPKNDPSLTFGKREGRVLFRLSIFKALPPALLPHFLYLIAFGEFMLHFEPAVASTVCSATLQKNDWVSIIRCEGLGGYTGDSRVFASCIALAEFVICNLVGSAAFVHRTLPLFEEPPWRRNRIWLYSVMVGLLLTAGYLGATLEKETFGIFPWYFYLLAAIMPFFCLFWNELLKRSERSLLDRAEKLRRLQFETRLGMWSPK